MEMEKGSRCTMFDEDHVTNSSSKLGGRSIPVNPWVVKCTREHLTSIVAGFEATKQPMNFLLLEDLTAGFLKPCILDLKMGTQQYDDTDSIAKQHRKMFKADTTTSGKLGVRIQGMQVYQVTTGHFLCRNKFYGRLLSSNGFNHALHHFLHNGVRLRTDVLPPLIRRLEDLCALVQKLDALRLFTTSLLLIYEGYTPDSTLNSISARRLPSFEKKESGVAGHSGGKWKLEQRGSAESVASREEEQHEWTTESLDKCEAYRHSSCCMATRIHSQLSFIEQQTCCEPLTDVRIIDFAHATNRSMAASSAVYSGPDRGFLFGLQNTITILASIASADRSC